MSCRTRSLTKLLMALLLFVETPGHIVNRKQNIAKDTILEDEDVEGAAAALPLGHLVAESSSWQPGIQRLRNHQRLMLSRLLVPQGPHHHGDRHPEMGVTGREFERHQMSPVIFRRIAKETDGETISRLRLLPSGPSQGVDDYPIVVGKRDLCCSLDMYCVDCTEKRRRRHATVVD